MSEKCAWASKTEVPQEQARRHKLLSRGVPPLRRPGGQRSLIPWDSLEQAPPSPQEAAVPGRQWSPHILSNCLNEAEF